MMDIKNLIGIKELMQRELKIKFTSSSCLETERQDFYLLISKFLKILNQL